MTISIGNTAVLFGMIGETCFGLMFTPAFYTFVRKLGSQEAKEKVSEAGAHGRDRGSVLPA